jgi:hypothetical protein
MQGKLYKTNKTQEELIKDLNAGKPVKAIDLISSMGIKVINFE